MFKLKARSLGSHALSGVLYMGPLGYAPALLVNIRLVWKKCVAVTNAPAYSGAVLITAENAL